MKSTNNTYRNILLGLLCAVSSLAYADQRITLEVTDTLAPTYTSLHARAQEAILERTWEDGECVSVAIENPLSEGPAYRLLPTESGNWRYFISKDMQAILLASLDIASIDVGLEFADSASFLFTYSDFSVNAPVALSEAAGSTFDGERLVLGVDALRPTVKPQVKIVGDFNFASGTLAVNGPDLMIRGKGLIDTLQCSEASFTPSVKLFDNSEAHRSSFLYVKNLQMDAGTLDVKTEGEESTNAWLWARKATIQGNGTRLNVMGQGALVLGDAFEELSYADFQNGTGAVSELTSMMGSVALAQGSVRPTLVSRQLDGATQGLGVGSVLIGTAASVAKSAVTLGADARWILLYDTALQSDSCQNISHEAGSELVIYGWDGVDVTLPLGWEADAVSLVNAAVPRGRVEVLGNDRLKLTRELMQTLEPLQAKALVKVVEDGWGTLATYGPGRSYVARALESEAVGKDAFVNLIDTSVALPFASGIALASERAFSTLCSDVMLRPMTKTSSAVHYWADGNATKLKAKEAFGEYGVKADMYRVGLGADVALGEDWMLSGGVFGVKLKTDSEGATVPIDADASMLALNALLERRFEKGALRFSLAGARSSTNAKRVALEHILKGEPTLSFASAGVGIRMDFGKKVRFTPHLGVSANFAKSSDADVKDTGMIGGISGTGFVVDAKNRFWGRTELGCELASKFALQGVDIVPSLELMGSAAFGERSWKITSRYPESEAKADEEFASAPHWEARVALGVNLARKSTITETTGGFFGLGAKPTGKTVQSDWTLDLRCVYGRSEHGESSTAVGVVFRKNW